VIDGDSGSLTRVFVGEAERHEGLPLYEWIVRQARARGLAGATASLAMMGYGASSLEIHTKDRAPLRGSPAGD